MHKNVRETWTGLKTCAFSTSHGKKIDIWNKLLSFSDTKYINWSLLPHPTDNLEELFPTHSFTTVYESHYVKDKKTLPHHFETFPLLLSFLLMPWMRLNAGSVQGGVNVWFDLTGERLEGLCSPKCFLKWAQILMDWLTIVFELKLLLTRGKAAQITVPKWCWHDESSNCTQSALSAKFGNASPPERFDPWRWRSYWYD